MHRRVVVMVVATLCLIGSSGPAEAATSRRHAASRPRARTAVQGNRELVRLRAVERRLDATGWDWRRAGIRVRLGYHPELCCHWGVYDSRNRTIWIGPNAFANRRRLDYVVLHETAHAWQYTSGHLAIVVRDMSPWKRTVVAAIESQDDCVAEIWGSGRGHYWACPAAARKLTERRLAGDWG